MRVIKLYDKMIESNIPNKLNRDHIIYVYKVAKKETFI